MNKMKRNVFLSGLMWVVFSLHSSYAFIGLEITDPPLLQDAPPPAYSSVSYGPFQRNLLDFWQVGTDGPAPLVVFIHGGGFSSGDKSQAIRAANMGYLNQCLENGVSFAAINYRFKADDCIDTILFDIARAIQFLRFKAGDWKINKQKVAAYGGSAGGGASLWLACHDDLADPSNPDPVLRESTRLTVAGHLAGQATYDFEKWACIIGVSENWMEEMGRGEDISLYHISDRSMLGSPEISALRKEVDMVFMIDPFDPPLYLINLAPEGEPETDARIVHHPRHALLCTSIKYTMNWVWKVCWCSEEPLNLSG